MSAPLSQIPDFDADSIVKEHGGYSVSCISPDTDALAVACAIAEACKSLGDLQRHQVEVRAKSAFRAAKIDGGPRLIAKAFGAVKRREVSASALKRPLALASRFEILPKGALPCTDFANANRLLQDHGPDIRFVRELGWVVWDGRRWALDVSGAAERMAHKVACDLEQRAAELIVQAATLAARGDDEAASSLRGESKVLRAWAEKSQQAKNIASCLRVAMDLEGIRVAANAFDTDPWLLSCENGTLDLRTGELRPHRREDLITRLAPVTYDPRATCPVWIATLERILPDLEVRAFLERWSGYTLTGLTTEQCLVVLWGDGSNGKSTVLEAQRFPLGDYAANTTTDTLMFTRERRGPQNDIARLRGARMVTAAESGEGRRLDEELIKRLTGGDTITARFLFKEHFEFAPSFKLWLAVNDRPEIRGVDHGIWRRMRLVHFGVTIGAEEQDHDLTAKLRAEAPGILAWAVRGCLEWQRIGLQAPQAVVSATDEWRSESNVVAQFVDECCECHEAAKQKSASLYEAFAKWSRAQGTEPLDVRVFGKRIGALGFTAKRTNQDGRIWLGLSLRYEQDTRGGG